MAFFGLFGSKPKQTPLIEWCAAISMEKAVADLPEEPSPRDLTLAYSLVLLHISHKFWRDMSEIKELKDYLAKTSPNVVIFETLVFSWSVVTTTVERWAEDKLFLDAEDPYIEALNDGLHVALSVMQSKWPELTPKDYLRYRLYPLGFQKSIEKFIGHLEGSEGCKVPTNNPNQNLSLNQTMLSVMVMPFATHMLSGVADSFQRLLEHVIEQQG